MGLREQAALDSQAILEDDLSGFAWPLTLTSPLGVVTSLRGFTTDVGQTIDPETGQAVAGRRASVTVARASLPALPEAVAESSRKPWLATFADSRGVVGLWKVVEVLPDAALGVVVLIVEVYQRHVVRLGGKLTLPKLQLSGSVAPRVSIGGSLTLLALQLSGAVAPRVSIGGSLTLPALQLSGSLTTEPDPIAAMLDLGAGTIAGIGYSSVPDLFASNPAVQLTNARRPLNGTSNGQAIATYVADTPSNLTWPAVTNNDEDLIATLGFAGWFKFTSYSGIFRCVIAMGGSTGLYDNAKFELYVDSSRRVNCYYFGQDSSGYNGRLALSQGASLPAVNTWFFLRTAFVGGAATEALRMRTFVDESEKSNTFSNFGTGGTPIALRNDTANIPYVIGAYANGDRTYAIAAVSGPLMYLIKGELSAAQGLALMNHRRPTP